VLAIVIPPEIDLNSSEYDPPTTRQREYSRLARLAVRANQTIDLEGRLAEERNEKLSIH
jgi:hypothetical protein